MVSRSVLDLVREFKFRHAEGTWTGIPIVAANMDTTGLISNARVLQGHKMLTCTQKFYSTREFSEAWADGVEPRCIAVTCGSTIESFDLLKRKIATNEDLNMICIDVANGYREVFLQFVRKVRKEFPEKIIIAGNVATLSLIHI